MHFGMGRKFCGDILNALLQCAFRRKQQTIGAAQIMDRLTAEAAPFKPDNVQPGQRCPVAQSHSIRNHIIFHPGQPADNGMSANPHANGGELLTPLSTPHFRDYAVEVSRPGAVKAEATRVLGTYLRDVIKFNLETRNFRLFGPDELDEIVLHPPIQRFLQRWRPGDPSAYLGRLWVP